MQTAQAALERALARKRNAAVQAGLAGSAYGAELHAAEAERTAGREHEQRLLAEVARLQREHAEQRRALLTRKRDRQTLDALRDQSQQAARRHQLRRDQAALDEAYLRAKSRG